MIERSDLNELIARDRRMYHLLWNANSDKIASVLEHGLERSRSNYHDFWESRSGHVYFGRMDQVKKIFTPTLDGGAYVKHVGFADWALFSVDLSHLEPQKVNPDEDHFHWSGGAENQEATRRFRLPFSPCDWAWQWAKYLGIHPPASLGEWAEAISLGSDPATTRHSAAKGRLSYNGVVPPAALHLVRSNVAIS